MMSWEGMKVAFQGSCTQLIKGWTNDGLFNMPTGSGKAKAQFKWDHQVKMQAL